MADGPGSAPQNLSSLSQKSAWTETGLARWHCLACVYSGVGSYARLRDSLIEVVGDTRNPVLAIYLDKEVPVVVCMCVCNFTLPVTLPFKKKRTEIVEPGNLALTLLR